MSIIRWLMLAGIICLSGCASTQPPCIKTFSLVLPEEGMQQDIVDRTTIANYFVQALEASEANTIYQFVDDPERETDVKVELHMMYFTYSYQSIHANLIFDFKSFGNTQRIRGIAAENSYMAMTDQHKEATLAAIADGIAKAQAPLAALCTLQLNDTKLNSEQST